MPGPPPKPTQLRVIEAGGKLRARYRRRAAREPVPTVGAGAVPPEFTPEQAAVWAEVEQACPPGLVTRLDRELLKGYVVCAAARDSALRLFNASGANLLVRGADPRDRAVANPFWREYRRCTELLRLLGQELGTSPASRTRIQIEPPAEDDPLARFFGPTR